VTHYDEPPVQEEKVPPSRNHFHFEDDLNEKEETLQPPDSFRLLLARQLSSSQASSSDVA
jgi:hypothetical protein